MNTGESVQTGEPPTLGVLHEGPRPQPRIARAMSDLHDSTAPSDQAEHDDKRRRVTIDPQAEIEQYELTTLADTPQEMPGTPVDSPVQPVSEDVLPDTEAPQQPAEDQAMDDLQTAIEVPVPDDDEGAMKKEWKSWIENKVTSIVKVVAFPLKE